MAALRGPPPGGWPRTRQQDLGDRRRQRRWLITLGCGTALIALASAGWGLHIDRAPLAVMSILVATSGALTAGLQWRRSPVADPSLPTWADLEEADPRRARSLAARQRDWLLGAALWVAGWAIAAVAMALLPSDGRLLRMLIFLGSTCGGVLAGTAWMRKQNGETRWPRR